MRPYFGCDIHELLFAPYNLNTAGLAAQYVVEALEKWEPRIEDIVADANPDPNEPHKLLIDIKYKVRGQNVQRNLVYPFYLRRSDQE